VLYPFVPPDALDDAVIERLRTLFAAHRLFEFRLATSATFAGTVLYLEPDPSDPFVELSRTVWAAFPDHPPYGGQFGDLVPHLTVVDCPRAGCDPEAVIAEAEAAVRSGLPITARADSVWLMAGNETWSTLERFSLGL
jgi:hypothetical protein